MKKTSIIWSLILGMAMFTACDDEENSPIVEAPSYDQNTVADAFSIEQTALAETVDLNKVTDMTASVALVTMTPPSDATLGEYTVVVAKDEALEEPISGFNYTYDEKTTSFNVTYEQLDKSFKTIFGKRPTARTLYMKVSATYKSGDVLLCANSKVLSLVVVPTSNIVLEEAYYLVSTNNAFAQDTTAVQFKHSSTDVYDDPVFTVIAPFPTTEKGVNIDFEYRIVPKSVYDAWVAGTSKDWTNVFGCATDKDVTSPIEISAENSENSMMVSATGNESAKVIAISVDMEKKVCTSNVLNFGEYVYTPGGHQGWAPATAVKLYGANYDGNYSGYLYLDGDFKITSADNWDGTNYGIGGEGQLSTSGADLSAEAGSYYMSVNLAELTYQLTPIKEWGIIGEGIGGWGDTDDIMLTYDKENNVWSAEDVTFVGGEIKFRADHAWAINVGGKTTDKLSNGGPNLIVAAGVYDVKLYLTNDNENHVELTKK